MNLTGIKNNLDKITSIIKNYEDNVDKNGDRFNIFSILNVSSSEVRLHSNFIAELLNNKGTHSYGNKFCKLFISELLKDNFNIPISKFNLNKYDIEVEKSTGLINEDYTLGGRIDIVLTDNLKNRIIIENKIYASDQKNQLLRYYNFDKNATLLYLSLSGDPPSRLSTNGEIEQNKDFYCISYQTFILEWLEKCIKISKNKPKVKETISQYLQIIKNFTNQNERNIMTNDIVKLIAGNKYFYKSIEDINQAYHIFRQSVNDKFWIEIRKKSPSKLICRTEGGIEVKYVIEEDGEGFYFGFYLENEGKRIEGTDECVKQFALIFKEISSSFNTNENYIGWTFSNTFKKFWWIGNEKIFDLNSDNEMDNFTNEIINELNKYIDEINKRIK